jgi:TonB family protein
MARSPSARLPQRRDRPTARVALAVAASLVLNGAALAALGAAGAFTLASRPARVELAAVSSAAWEANRRIAAPGAPPPAPAAAVAPARAPSPRPEVPSARIVDVAPSSDPRRPVAARFLAERDNTVPRDVQYRGPLADRRGPVAARPTGGTSASGGIPLPGEEGTSDDAAPGREGSRAAADAAVRIAAARLALAADGERPAAPDPGIAAGSPSAGDGGARRIGRFDPRLLPVGDRFEGVGAGSPMAERLRGVAEGEETRLNTRAFKYADFYRRVAEAIRSEWDPNGAWDALDPQDRVFGREARTVAVDIVLDRGGRLLAAKVATTSGLPFFDREALRAIDAAAPFPNPPEGLVDAEGRVVLERYGLRFEWPEHALFDRLMGAGGR